MKSRFRSNFTQIWFGTSVAFISFLMLFAYGFACAKLRFFPYHHVLEIHGTFESLKALMTLNTESSLSAHAISLPGKTSGVTVNHLPLERHDELVFLTLFADGEFRARLIDRSGDVLHAWRLPFSSGRDFGLARDTGIELGHKNTTIHGAHLYEDGELLLVLEYNSLIKIDRESRLLWKLDTPAHHAVAVDPDDSIWTLSRRRVSDEGSWVPLATEPYWEDQLLHVSADGVVTETISLLDVIFDNHYEGILYGGPPGKPVIGHSDPLHANDVDVLDAEAAERLPGGAEAGDLMLSMRAINTVMVIDPASRRIKWTTTGPFLRQHDPDFTNDGALLVFDNRTAVGQTGIGARYLPGTKALGHSRILALDPISREVIWEFGGSEEKPFYTSIQGKLAPLSNGNVLVVEPEGGRVFEFVPRTQQIVWELVNRLDENLVGRVTQAEMISEEKRGF